MEIAAGPDKRPEAVQVMRDNGLQLILMAFGESSNFADHRRAYEKGPYAIAAHKPLFINTQTGRN